VVRGLFIGYDRGMSMRARQVAVVGGGPAGLAAAWGLSEAGRTVRVYEAGPLAGGRLRTEVLGETAADPAVQLLSGGYDRTRALASALGAEARLVPVPGRDALWRGGEPHALEYGSLLSLAGSGALPARMKMKLGLRYVPFLERHRGALDLNEPVRAAAAGLDGESIAEWGTRKLGREFVELLVYPLLAAYYGVTPEETSAAFFHALARTGLGVEVLGVRGGVGALASDLVDGLARRGVELWTDAPVGRVEVSATGVRVAARGQLHEHPAVVVATPPAVAARLLPGVAQPAGVRVRSTATLVLATRSPLRTGWFGLSIPRTEAAGSVLAAVCVQGEKGTGVVGSGGAVVLVPAPPVGERWASAEPRSVVSEAVPVLETILPGVSREIVEGRLVRLEDRVWLPEPGYFDALRRLRPQRLPDRLALAGDYLVSPTVEGAVRSGLAAADRLAPIAGS
jgi:oxygen-dependent protoporphyrinogen oxidase